MHQAGFLHHLSNSSAVTSVLSKVREDSSRRPTEAGQDGENPIGTAAAAGILAGPGGVWDLLAQRLRGIPEYVTLFMDAYPGEVTSAGDITFVHAANAIGRKVGHHVEDREPVRSSPVVHRPPSASM